MTGNALVFPPFERVRQAASAGDKKTAWSKILGDFSDLGLPNWSSAPKIEAEMDQWERDNASRLGESESGGSHLFGFNGQNVLSGIFDFVLVTADLRAQEESTDSRGHDYQSYLRENRRPFESGRSIFRSRQGSHREAERHHDPISHHAAPRPRGRARAKRSRPSLQVERSG